MFSVKFPPSHVRTEPLSECWTLTATSGVFWLTPQISRRRELPTYSAAAAFMHSTHSLAVISSECFCAVLYTTEQQSLKEGDVQTDGGASLSDNLILFLLLLQENAGNGDHLWMETSCSGELCYLGEDACLLKTAVSKDWSRLCKRETGTKEQVLLLGLYFCCYLVR